jgi:hypothetical protein
VAVSLCRRASWITPTSDWLMTAVGPPPWATRTLPDDIDDLLFIGGAAPKARSLPRLSNCELLHGYNDGTAP